MSARLKMILLVIFTVGVVAILIAVPRTDSNAVAGQDRSDVAMKSSTPRIEKLVDQRLGKSSSTDQAILRPANKPKVYTVRDKDTLWQISEDYFGHGKHWQSIAKANPRLVTKSGRIKKGVKLIIPHRAQ